MQIRFHCPTDGCVAIVEYEPLEEAGGGIDCPRCKKRIALAYTEAMRDRGIVDQCSVCGSRELFIRKDFPQAIGLAIVVVAGICSVIFYRTNILWAWAALATALLIDLALYLAIGKVTTCYACRAEYRKAGLNPEHEGFDLATSEKF